MTTVERGVLLDTCALVWLANGDHMPASVMTAITSAGRSGGIFVSPISAWEIGMLANPRGNRPGLRFSPNVKAWFSRLMGGPGIREAALTPDIAVDASFLPGDLHADPADRLLIATARHLDVPIVTRDARIVAYAGRDFVEVLAC